MKTYKTDGIILGRRNIGESDRILTVFTRKHGKIQVKATGVRKVPSRRSAHVELLNLSLLTLYKGKSLATLIEAQTVTPHTSIKNDLKKVGYAYHICELVDSLCPENQENTDVFDLFLNTLQQLSNEDDSLKVVHDFEVALLTMLGFYTSIQEHSDTIAIIEGLLERKLKSRQILHYFL